MKRLRILMLGDIIGRPGRRACRDRVHVWRKELELDAVMANGENASGGNGLTVKNAGDLFDAGLDLITSGNHIWQQKDFAELFEKFPRVIRPANYPPEVPGSGWGLIDLGGGTKVAVLNLQGQVFMDPIDSPFKAAERDLAVLKGITPLIIVDFHAEATSERVAMGIFLEGRVSAVLGTHTHVPTADDRILPGGTAYQTDVGMVGPIGGVIGVESEAILQKFTTGLPSRFEVAKGPVICNGTVLTIDSVTGKALEIERFQEMYDPSEEVSRDEGNDK